MPFACARRTPEDDAPRPATLQGGAVSYRLRSWSASPDQGALAEGMRDRPEIAPDRLRPPQTEAEQWQQRQPHRQRAPYTDTALHAVIALRRLVIHDPEVVQEGNEDDDQKAGHDKSCPCGLRFQPGPQDRHLAG